MVLDEHNRAVYLLCILALSVMKNKYEAQSGRGIIWLLENLPNTGLSDSFFIALKIILFALYSHWRLQFTSCLAPTFATFGYEVDLNHD